MYIITKGRAAATVASLFIFHPSYWERHCHAVPALILFTRNLDDFNHQGRKSYAEHSNPNCI